MAFGKFFGAIGNGKIGALSWQSQANGWLYLQLALPKRLQGKQCKLANCGSCLAKARHIAFGSKQAPLLICSLAGSNCGQPGKQALQLLAYAAPGYAAWPLPQQQGSHSGAQIAANLQLAGLQACSWQGCGHSGYCL